jgi:hypothetical protein
MPRVFLWMGLFSAISGFSCQFFLEVSVCDSYLGKLPGLAPAAVMSHRLFAFTRRYK